MDARSDPIKHVVVLMLENRSFDQMLGALKEVYPELDGVDPQSPRKNVDDKGKEFWQTPTTTLCITPDPKHDLKAVLQQIGASDTYYPPHVPDVFKRIWIIVAELAKAAWTCAKSLTARPKREPARMTAKQYEGHFVLNYSQEYPESTAQQRQEIMGYFPMGGGRLRMSCASSSGASVAGIPMAGRDSRSAGGHGKNSGAAAMQPKALAPPYASRSMT